MSIFTKFISVFLLMILGTVSSAQDKSFSLEDVSFFTGHWIGEAFGGTVEEVWTEPSGNAIMGMFRLQKNNMDALYEFLLIEKTNTGVQIRFKHIKPNYIEMEKEPIVLNLIDADKTYAHFESDDQCLAVKYNKTQLNILEIEVASTKNGITKVTPIKMNRKK